MKKKLFYICLVVLPLLLADGLIIAIMQHNYRVEQQMIMENMADTVEAELRNVFEETEAITNSLYIDREINLFLSNRYESPLDFYDASRAISGRRFYEILVGRGSENIVMCSDNPTLVNGGRYQQISEIR